MKFIDIGANLTDLMYQGSYHGSKKHNPDLEQVLERSWSVGIQKMIITGGSLGDSQKALQLARTEDRLYSTVGCHPTRCLEIEEDSSNPGSSSYLEQLSNLAKENPIKVVAWGEIGLDYDRLQFCPKDIQIKHLKSQLDLVEQIPLPLFLHCRNSSLDLAEILNSKRDILKGGVVHSFDGSAEDAKTFLDLGYFIGLNGCSLKTSENLAMIQTLPVDRILLETDCPWCEVRPSHAGFKVLKEKNEKFEVFPTVKKEKWTKENMVKSRNEPCNIVNVLKIISHTKEEEMDALAETIFNNTMKLYFSS